MSCASAAVQVTTLYSMPRACPGTRSWSLDALQSDRITPSRGGACYLPGHRIFTHPHLPGETSIRQSEAEYVAGNGAVNRPLDLVVPELGTDSSIAGSCAHGTRCPWPLLLQHEPHLGISTSLATDNRPSMPSPRHIHRHQCAVNPVGMHRTAGCAHHRYCHENSAYGLHVACSSV